MDPRRPDLHIVPPADYPPPRNIPDLYESLRDKERRRRRQERAERKEKVLAFIFWGGIVAGSLAILWLLFQLGGRQG
jgi:hypothetical protein